MGSRKTQRNKAKRAAKKAQREARTTLRSAPGAQLMKDESQDLTANAADTEGTEATEATTQEATTEQPNTVPAGEPEVIAEGTEQIAEGETAAPAASEPGSSAPAISDPTEL